jgi:hypothetical protein
MMGRQDRDQRQLFYEFSLDEMIPADHLLRRRGDGEFLFLAEGRPIKRKTYCTRSNAAQMRLIASSNSTIRSDFGAFA